jgi:hypothetical protein
MEAAIKAGKYLGIVNCKKISLTNNCLKKTVASKSATSFPKWSHNFAPRIVFNVAQKLLRPY